MNKNDSIRYQITIDIAKHFDIEPQKANLLFGNLIENFIKSCEDSYFSYDYFRKVFIESNE